jgi:hypothetical protein
MLDREVQLHVPDVALADSLGPQRLHGLADQLAAGVAEQLLGECVHEHDPAVPRRGDDRIRQPLEHRGRRDQQRVGRHIVPGALRRSFVFHFVHDPASSVQLSPCTAWTRVLATRCEQAERGEIDIALASGQPL